MRNKVNNPVNNPVNSPEHYNQVGFECIDMMDLLFKENDNLIVGFLLGNAFKYIWRHKAKNGDEDLYKAEWYLNRVEELIVKFPSSIGDIHSFLKGSLKKARGEE